MIPRKAGLLLCEIQRVCSVDQKDGMSYWTDAGQSVVSSGGGGVVTWT